MPESLPLQPEDIGYFQPDLYDKNDAALVMIDGDIYYRDVYLFIDRVCEVARSNREELVKLCLPVCLRGARALQWLYTTMAEEREALQRTTLEQGWI